MAQPLEELASRIAGYLKQDLLSHSITHGQLAICVPTEAIVNVMMFLRDGADLHFRQLIDITSVDYPEREARFDVVYHLLSMKTNQRIRIKIAVADAQPVPSITGVFSVANWFEREIWDMFGIPFSNHPDLRRLLTDYGFEGFPLRKDFPLTGYTEVRYDTEQKRVVYEPVSLPQEFRTFDFLSPWEGGVPYGALPGDEKASGYDEAPAEANDVKPKKKRA